MSRKNKKSGEMASARAGSSKQGRTSPWEVVYIGLNGAGDDKAKCIVDSH